MKIAALDLTVMMRLGPVAKGPLVVGLSIFTLLLMLPLTSAFAKSAAPAVSKSTALLFSKHKIQIGSKTVRVELADTKEKAAQGLMYRKSINLDEGMLFIFPDEQVRSFWMKNTFIDLSIGFFDKKKILIDIQEMKAAQSEMVVDLPSYISKKPAQFALEMNKEWFKKNKIAVGAKFKNLD
jgi:uncharacterized membrane protein (UPF0127 family)